MDVVLRNSYDAARDLEARPFHSACYAPFVSMYFRTSGEVVACCKSQTLVLGHVGRQRIGEIWNGARYGALRKALAAYQLPTGCEFCAWQLASGDVTGVFARQFDDIPAQAEVPRWPAVMEFSLSNVCNFECVQCDGENSSLIRAKRDRLPPLANPYDDRFHDDLREFLPHLSIAKFLGGEPFLTAGCFRIFDSMIEARLTTPCYVTTNGSQYNPRVERVLENLPVSIIFSIDGVTKATLEAIRVNARHEVLIENARRLVDYTKRRGTTFLFSFCVMRRNWREFGDFLRFAESLAVGTNVCIVTNPREESLYTLPTGELREVVSQLERQGDALLPELTLNRRAWLENLTSLRLAASEEQVARAARMPTTMNEANADDPFMRALALERDARTAEALAEAERVPESHPWRYVALVLAARLKRTLRRLVRCEETIDSAIALAPGRPEAFIERAWLRLEQQRLEEGLAEVERVRAMLASWPRFEPDLCEIAFQLLSGAGRGDEAGRELSRLFELERERARPYVLRGWALRSIGRDAEARKDALTALELEPANESARRLAALV